VLLPGFPNPVRLTVSADIDPAGLPLAGIGCSLHVTAEQAAAGGRTIVRLRPGERLDRDFILRLAMAEQDRVATSLVLTPDPGEDPAEGTFTLTLLPPAAHGRPRARDVVLVLDRSGSMRQVRAGPQVRGGDGHEAGKPGQAGDAAAGGFAARGGRGDGGAGDGGRGKGGGGGDGHGRRGAAGAGPPPGGRRGGHAAGGAGHAGCRTGPAAG
jgi:hypothetical protein